MSSDAAYNSFLDQANQDTGSGSAKAQAEGKKKGGKGGQQLRTADTAVPAALKSLDAYYESEVDEQFEGVALQWDGDKDIGEDEFAELVEHTSSVETLSTKSFDPRGQYKDVISAVEQETDGKVKVFRIETDRSRVAYYIVGIQEKSGKKQVVGVKANAVES